MDPIWSSGRSLSSVRHRYDKFPPSVVIPGRAISCRPSHAGKFIREKSGAPIEEWQFGRRAGPGARVIAFAGYGGDQVMGAGRVARAMLVSPPARWSPIAVLRRVAMTAGPFAGPGLVKILNSQTRARTPRPRLTDSA